MIMLGNVAEYRDKCRSAANIKLPTLILKYHWNRVISFCV